MGDTNPCSVSSACLKIEKLICTSKISRVSGTSGPSYDLHFTINRQTRLHYKQTFIQEIDFFLFSVGLQ